jgi:hypothetical protein
VIDVVLLWVLRARKPNKDSVEIVNENSNYINVGNLIYADFFYIMYEILVIFDYDA